jgi:predicted RNase H-like HicB family nuclease
MAPEAGLERPSVGLSLHDQEHLPRCRDEKGRHDITSVMKFTVVLAPEPASRYTVICPAIPGCVSQGESVEDALSNIREAILLCLEVRRPSLEP